MPEPTDLLKEILDNHTYARDYWRPIYEEGATDIRYLTEGPWTEKEREERTGRVTLWLDELSQYTNQIKNEFRQSKRAVKLTPKGSGADDAKAEKRAAMIRDIEYDSKAQHAYITCGESMVDRSYGFYKLRTDYVPGRMLRRIVVSPIANPECILIDPDFKEPDASDCAFGFEIEEGMRVKEFVRRFGKKATITSFDADHCEASKGWISSSDHGYKVRLAAYYRREVATERTLYLLENGQEVKSDEIEGAKLVKQARQEFLYLPDGTAPRVIESREDNEYAVRQYITNGLEVLEDNDTDFDEVPLIPMFGPMVWVPQGGVSKLKIFSAVRRARDGAKAFCFVKSAAVERASMDVKTPYEGWEGQFNTSTDWANANKSPVGYVEFKPVELPNGALLTDKPTRNLSEPQLTQHEVLAESLRRSIQAGVGGSPLPTSAQRQNQKSGVALQTIEQSQDQGNYHFVDNYNRALERGGRMINKALKKVYDTPRDQGFRTEDEKYAVERINEVDPQTQQPVGFHTADGEFGETISTGPSYQSQRDAADAFLDKLAASEMFPRVADLVVKLKNLGPIGDQIAERLAPPGAEGVDPAVQQAMAQAQQVIQELQAELADLRTKATIDKYKADLQANTAKYQTDEQEKTKRVIALEELNWKAAEARLTAMLTGLEARFNQMHEAMMAGAQMDHDDQARGREMEHERGMRGAEMQHDSDKMERQHEQAREMAAAQPQEAK